MNDKARRKEEASITYTAIVQGLEDSQTELFQTIESDAGSDISELDPLKKERIRNLQSTNRPTSSTPAISKRLRSVVNRPRFGCLLGPTGAYCDLGKYMVTCF
jgi:hypothetical protein